MRKAKDTATRRRGPELEEALLAAAWDEVRKDGFMNLTMDGVASRAGTSKTVLYRRWSSRAELVLAAMRRFAPMEDSLPDTGSLRGDTLELLRRISVRFRQYPDIVLGLMTEMPQDQVKVQQMLVCAMRLVMNQAIARGELGQIEVSDRLASLPFDLARYEMYVAQSALKTKEMKAIVDDIFMPLITSLNHQLR